MDEPCTNFYHTKCVENPREFDVKTIPNDLPEGYILEVDIKYPQHLHDKHYVLNVVSRHASNF